MRLYQLLLLLVCCNHITSIPITTITNAARIVNGVEKDIKDIPYQASLRRKVLSGWAHICGAVVISDRGVLTAAHCVDSYVTQPHTLRVTVGASSRTIGGKNYEIATVHLHEEFSPATLDHDIALLETAKSIEFGPTVAPIAVATTYFVLPHGTGALVSGYGTTSYEGVASDVLLVAKVSVVDQKQCARAYLRIATISNGMVCAAGVSPPRDACQGDSGGPLVTGDTLIGIVSWGEGCANSDYPGVYTRVSTYYTWIQEKLRLIQRSR